MNRSFFYKSLTKKLQLSPKPKLARLIINYRGVRLNTPPLSLDFFGLDQLGVFRTSEQKPYIEVEFSKIIKSAFGILSLIREGAFFRRGVYLERTPR